MKFRLYSARSGQHDFDHATVMGIINATPDSFSDGGQYAQSGYIENVLNTGVRVVDVGAESTRPGADEVDAETELSRLIPVIEQIRSLSQTVLISVDTQKAIVAQAALNAGADFINDISSLHDPEMAGVIKSSGCSVVLMRNRPLSPDDLVGSAQEQIEQLTNSACQQGIDRTRIIVDPGLGFGDLQMKDYQLLPGGDPAANLSLVENIDKYSGGFPVLIGGSRKRFIGVLTGQDDAKDRLGGSIGLALLADKQGASLIRVHDAQATLSALSVFLSRTD